MNIKSLLKAVSVEKPAVQTTNSDSTRAQNATQKGISAYSDVFETHHQRPNFFDGKLLNETSFNQEQNYHRDKQGEGSYGVFDLKARYSGIHLQQGRVKLDQDLNETSDNKDDKD